MFLSPTTDFNHRMLTNFPILLSDKDVFFLGRNIVWYFDVICFFAHEIYSGVVVLNSFWELKHKD